MVFKFSFISRTYINKIRYKKLLFLIYNTYILFTKLNKTFYNKAIRRFPFFQKKESKAFLRANKKTYAILVVDEFAVNQW